MAESDTSIDVVVRCAAALSPFMHEMAAPARRQQRFAFAAIGANAFGGAEDRRCIAHDPTRRDPKSREPSIMS